MKQSDMVKLNDDELNGWPAYGSPYRSIEQKISATLLKLTGVKILCVTLGSHGAVLYMTARCTRHCGFRVKVVDTVGSGDSFLAV